MKVYFTPGQVCRLTGLSYRQLQYYDRTGFISPSIRRRGKYRLYTSDDAVALFAAVTLRSGEACVIYSVQRLRRVLGGLGALLAKRDFPFSDVLVLVIGDGVAVVRNDAVFGGRATDPWIKIYVRPLLDRISSMFPEDPEFSVSDQAVTVTEVTA